MCFIKYDKRSEKKKRYSHLNYEERNKYIIMKFLTISTVMAGLASSIAHPTLPTMWTAKVKEQGVGVVYESEHFAKKESPSNPNAKWTNYTDGSCQRLILEKSNADNMRYLLGCDAVDCCYEEGTWREREHNNR